MRFFFAMLCASAVGATLCACFLPQEPDPDCTRYETTTASCDGNTLVTVTEYHGGSHCGGPSTNRTDCAKWNRADPAQPGGVCIAAGGSAQCVVPCLTDADCKPGNFTYGCDTNLPSGDGRFSCVVQ